MDECIHPIYLRFSADRLNEHAPPGADAQVGYYLKSAITYRDFLGRPQEGLLVGELRGPCQMEKDEWFWTAACLMAFFHLLEPQRVGRLAALMRARLGDAPPVPGLPTWEACFRGELRLFLEAVMPSPQGYHDWLKAQFRERHLVPYVHRAAARTNAGALEGPTHVDALLLNESNGFAVMFEAKVVSDISTAVTFDAKRNQLARNISYARSTIGRGRRA